MFCIFEKKDVQFCVNPQINKVDLEIYGCLDPPISIMFTFFLCCFKVVIYSIIIQILQNNFLQVIVESFLKVEMRGCFYHFCIVQYDWLFCLSVLVKIYITAHVYNVLQLTFPGI